MLQVVGSACCEVYAFWICAIDKLHVLCIGCLCATHMYLRVEFISDCYAGQLFIMESLGPQVRGG
jgi:hypothetical protein